MNTVILGLGASSSALVAVVTLEARASPEQCKHYWARKSITAHLLNQCWQIAEVLSPAFPSTPSMRCDRALVRRALPAGGSSDRALRQRGPRQPPKWTPDPFRLCQGSRKKWRKEPLELAAFSVKWDVLSATLCPVNHEQLECHVVAASHSDTAGVGRERIQVCWLPTSFRCCPAIVTREAKLLSAEKWSLFLNMLIRSGREWGRK